MNASSWHGLFIVLEGIDGSGKTTIGKMLFSFFQQRDLPVLLTAEPSQGKIGKIIRENLQDSSIHPAIDALLFAADRIDHGNNEILPALKKGYIVISDRYIDSSLIYQTIQGKNLQISIDWVKELNKFCLIPDKIYLLDIDANLSLARRKKQNSTKNEQMEKFEKLAFQQEIRNAFLKLAREDLTKNHRIVDASKQPKEILHDILKDLEKLFVVKGLTL
ncbi:dTMP kinase [Candidatus Harpocratesius sp.]